MSYIWNLPTKVLFGAGKVQELPHGAGLILISAAYFTHLIENHACDERFVEMAKAMGNQGASEPMNFIRALKDLQAACGVDNL